MGDGDGDGRQTAGNTPWGTWNADTRMAAMLGHEAGGASVIHAIRTAAGHKNGLK